MKFFVGLLFRISVQIEIYEKFNSAELVVAKVLVCKVEITPKRRYLFCESSRSVWYNYF